MASKAGPKIVNDGLVVYFDASNVKCYSTGLTYIDLALQKTISLGTQINYNTSNKGVFYFDGTTGTTTNTIYMSSTAIGTGVFPLPQFSVDMWFNSLGTGSTSSSIPGLFGLTNGLRIYFSGGLLVYGVSNSGGTITNKTVTNTFFNTGWHHVNAQNNGTTSFLYIDGVLQTPNISASWNGTTPWDTNWFLIGWDINNNSTFLW